MQGTITELELAIALRLLSQGGCTGELKVCLRSRAVATIGLENGEIVYATSEFGPHLGEVLVADRVVTSEKVEAAAWVQKSSGDGQRLGELLAQIGLVKRERIERALEEQITRVLADVLALREGSFHFESTGDAPVPRVMPARRDLGHYEIRVAMRDAADETKT